MRKVSSGLPTVLETEGVWEALGVRGPVVECYQVRVYWSTRFMRVFCMVACKDSQLRGNWEEVRCSQPIAYGPEQLAQEKG